MSSFRIDIPQKSGRNAVITPTHPVRLLRTARSSVDLIHDEAATIDPSLLSTSTSSLSISSDSVYDDVDAKTETVLNAETAEQFRRALSVPQIMDEEVDEGLIEKALDAATITNSHWISGDCSTSEFDTLISTSGLPSNSPLTEHKTDRSGKRLVRIIISHTFTSA